jgi:hypothetical protein
MRRTLLGIIGLGVLVQLFRCTSPAPLAGGVENGNGYVSGFVYTADGKPADGAMVRLTPVDYVPAVGLSKRSDVLPCTTDAHGHYAVYSKVDSGVYNVEAVQDTAGALLDSVKVTGLAGQKIRDAVLHALGGITGISFMPGQNDTSQVRVTIYMPGTPRSTKPMIGGRFSFETVPAGHYQMIFDPTLNLYHVKVLDVTVAPGQLLDLDTVVLYSDSITGLPKVDAGKDTTISMNDTIRLHGKAADPYGRIVRMEWDIGATGHFIATVSGDTAIYLGAIKDTVFPCVLRATDNDSNKVCDTVRIKILQDIPICHVTARDTIAYPGDTDFISVDFADTLGTVTKIEWDIGATGTFVKHSSLIVGDTVIVIPHSAGRVYKCVFRVTNSAGNTATDTARIAIVTPVLTDSIVEITLPVTVNAPLLFTEYSSATFPVVMFKWDFEADGIWDDSSSSSSVITHTFTTIGTKKIVCLVRDTRGNTAIDSMIVHVVSAVPPDTGTTIILHEADNPHIISSALVVPAGKTLIVEPGAVIYLDSEATIQVAGAISAKGTISNRILFSWNPSGTFSQWSSISIQNNSKGTFEYCDFSEADRVIDISGYHKDTTMVLQCNFGNSTNAITGVCCGAPCIIRHCHFEGIGSPLSFSGSDSSCSIIADSNIFIGFGLVMSDHGHLLFSNNSLDGQNYSEQGLCVSGVSATIINNTIQNNVVYGIGIQASATPDHIGIISHNMLTKNGGNDPTSPYGGIFCQDSQYTIEENTVSENKNGLVVSCPVLRSCTNNNILNNTYYDFKVLAVAKSDIRATGNWWGTSDTATIRTRIFDHNNDSTLGNLIFTPVLTSPVPDAGPP